MAYAVDTVTQKKNFDVKQQALDGTSVYEVSFTYDSLVDLSNYPEVALACMTAVDPVTALAIPAFGSLLSASLLTYVSDINPVINKGQQSVWTVNVTYEPPDDDEDDVVSEDPTALEVTYDWTEVLEREKIWIDANGVPVVTSAQNGFTSLPQVDNAYLSCTVSRNKNAYDPDDALSVINRINDAFFSIDGNTYAAGFVKCKGWRGKKRTVTVAGSGTVTYHSESLIFLIRDEVWEGRVFDQDTYYNTAIAAGTLKAGKHLIPVNGVPSRSPQALNGQGLPIAVNGVDGVNAAVDKAYDAVAPEKGVEKYLSGKVAMLVFRFWKEADFSVTGVT